MAAPEMTGAMTIIKLDVFLTVTALQKVTPRAGETVQQVK